MRDRATSGSPDVAKRRAGPSGGAGGVRGGAGNQAVIAALSGQVAVPVAVQRHFFNGVHEQKPGDKHAKHTVADATQAGTLLADLEPEVETLREGLKVAGTSAAAASAAIRLGKIKEIATSQLAMVKAVPDLRYQTRLRTMVDRATSGVGTAETVGKSRAAEEMLKKVQTEAPADLRALENHALKAASHANLTLTKGADSIKGLPIVAKPAAAAAAALVEAREAHGTLVSLGTAAADVAEAKLLVEAHMPSADRALELAVRMAGLAEAVHLAWKQAFDRSTQARSAMAKVAADLVLATEQRDAAAAEVLRLQEYTDALTESVAEWRLDPTAVQESLDQILLDAAETLAAARKAEVDTQARFVTATANIGLTREAELLEVKKEGASAKGVATGGLAEVTGATTELTGLADVRDLAGGPSGLQRFLTLIPDRAELKELLEALTARVALRWLTSPSIAPVKTKAMMAAFGKTGLADFVAGVGEESVDRLVAELAVDRLHELAADGGLGLAALKELLASFNPAAIDALAVALGVAPLRALLADVNAATLRSIGAETAKLKALLAKLTTGEVKALVTAVGALGLNGLLAALSGTRVGELAHASGLGAAKLKALLAAGITPSEVDAYATELGFADLKAFLVDVSAASLKALAITAVKLKALVADVPSAEIKGLITALTAAGVAGLVAELTPTQLKGLLVELPADALKRLGLTGSHLKDLLTQYTAAEIKGLAADLGDPALKDLLTKFTATQIKDFRTAVGADRLKELITVKLLKADALFKYKAPMLTTFVGADDGTWAHLADPPYISNSSGQIAGGHDRALFLAYIAQMIDDPAAVVLPGQPRPQIRRAVLVPTAVPTGDIVKVTYTRYNGVGGSKTIINNLTAQKAAWMAKFNKAIWNSIRTLVFPDVNGKFAATADGKSYSGFYNGGDAVDTIFPK